jgi:hypothetical protein
LVDDTVVMAAVTVWSSNVPPSNGSADPPAMIAAAHTA